MARTPGWPEPEVWARPAREGDPVPAAAQSIAKLARSNGWEVRLTYSRGTVPQASNRWEPGKVVDGILLRAQRGSIGIVLSWEDGKSRSGWLLVRNRGMAPEPINTLTARAILKATP